MRDKGKTKEQLIGELSDLRHLLKELESLTTHQMENAERYRAVAESLQDFIFILDRNSHVQYANNFMERELGYAKEEMVGKHIKEAFPPECYEFEWERIQKVFESEKPSRMEIKKVYPDREGWWETQLIPIRHKSGKVEFILGIGRDITEFKKMDEELKESEEKYRLIFQNIPESITITRVENGRYLSVNESFSRLSGYSREEAIDKTPFDLNLFVNPADREEFIRILKEKGEVNDFELQYRMRDGTILDTHLSGKPFRFKGEECLIAIVKDVTERKQADQALRESEEKYRTLVANANDAIFIAQDEQIKFPNPTTLALTGYSQEELATLPFLHLIHPEDRKMVFDRYSKRLKNEEVSTPYSFRIINKEGQELWVQINAVLITWEGRPATLNYVRDITPQKRLEAQYLHSQKMEAVGTLAGGIAHDFNNLLQAVLGYSEMLLLDNDRSWPGYQELQEIRRAALRGAELTQQLLTFSRRVQSKLRPVNLNSEVKQVQTLLQRTIPKMIEVDLIFVDDLRTVNADPLQIEQVLVNLAINARDAMPEGGKLMIGTQNVTLDDKYCKMHLGAKPGDYVLLTVSDTGQGMDKETLEHLFEPFYTTKGVGKGTGLGLAMVYGIVKSHEGYILCDSEPGKGTTLKIYLPVIEPEMGSEESKEEMGFRGGTETILLVDDEESIRNLGRQILTKLGYRVLTTSDGESALEVYQKEKVHLVILDLIMPGMGGVKCLEEFLKINPKVKVVIASGYSVAEPTKEALEKGAKSFIQKPFAMRQMFKVVREALDEDG